MTVPKAQDVNNVLGSADPIDALIAAFEDQDFPCAWQDRHTRWAMTVLSLPENDVSLQKFDR